jgi:hypothetical protein
MIVLLQKRDARNWLVCAKDNAWREPGKVGDQSIKARSSKHEIRNKQVSQLTECSTAKRAAG